MAKNSCKEFHEIFNPHLIECGECREAHVSVLKTNISDSEKLKFPCSQGFKIINNHTEKCEECTKQIDERVAQTANLIRTPEDVVN